jgi:hypothetical protein
LLIAIPSKGFLCQQPSSPALPVRTARTCLNSSSKKATKFTVSNAADLRNEAGDFINIGSGKELTIKQLAETIRNVIYEKDADVCRIIWDTSRLNGTPRKLCDISRLTALGFTAKTELYEGIKKAYGDFYAHRNF